MHERLLRIKEVLVRTGYSKSSIYKLITEGGFPKQIKIGVRAAAWPESVIDAWISAKMVGHIVTPKKGRYRK